MNVITRARLAALAAGLVVLSAQPARAAGNDYWAVDAFAVQDDDRLGDSKLGFGGRLARGFEVGEHTAFELGLFGNPIKVKDGTGPGGHQTGLMGDLVLAFGDGSVKPYILAGLGGVRERWTANFTNSDFAIEAGAGLRFAMASGMNLRLGATAQEVFNSDVSRSKDTFVDYRFNLGLLWPFGAAPVAAAAAPVMAPADSDGDGVIDSRDACPNVPAATPNGCPAPAPTAPPKDSDGDGVADNLDQCPGTLKGLTVDARGCVVAGGVQSVVLKGVNFKTGSAELTAEAKAVLDSAYTSLAGQAGLKVEVGGYTDSLGDAAKNTALSAARANSVRAYLVSKGIPADRLTAKGYGSAQPIADNKTKEGRAQNRRVELKVVK